MKFINTDGMAFIGPGSEWFWTALSGIVLAVTFIAIYRQLRLQRSQGAIEQIERLDLMPGSKEGDLRKHDHTAEDDEGHDQAHDAKRQNPQMPQSAHHAKAK